MLRWKIETSKNVEIMHKISNYLVSVVGGIGHPENFYINLQHLPYSDLATALVPSEKYIRQVCIQVLPIR